MACHNRQERILHRDLKPANILLTSNYSVKVCDFGLSTLTTTSSLAYSKVGTPLYMSPEQMHGLGYTDKSDIWSLGCIAYEMAALAPPFDAEDHFELQRMVKAGLSRRIPACFSDDLNRAIGWMLQANPDHRPNATELYNHLLQMSTKASQPQPPQTTTAIQAPSSYHAPPPPFATSAAPAQASLQPLPSVVYIPLWGFELQMITPAQGVRFFKVSSVFSGGKAFTCGLTADMELISINSVPLSSPRMQLHDAVQALAIASSNGGAGVTLELRPLAGRNSGSRSSIVFLTDDTSSDNPLLTARTLSIPPPPSSPAVIVVPQSLAQPPAAFARPAAAFMATPSAPADGSNMHPNIALAAQPQVHDSTESKSSEHSTHGTAAAVASFASTVAISGDDGKATDGVVIARMAARIDELERELNGLQRENAALKDAAQLARAECAALKQQQVQNQQVLVHDIKYSPTVAKSPDEPANFVFAKNLVVPPPPLQAPPNAPVDQQRVVLQQPLQSHEPLLLHHAFSPASTVDSTTLPDLFQQQLEQHAQVQMQQLQQRQQQFAQRQQQPISRPGPALASTFDALSYTNRDGLKLPALEPPQLLGLHTSLAGAAREALVPKLNTPGNYDRPHGSA
jgi:serine/threonine protein kinase